MSDLPVSSVGLRVAPRPWIAVTVFLGYLAVFYGVWIATGIDYPHIGDSTENALRWYVAPLAAGAVVLIAAVSYLGWWRPAIHEPHRAPRWLLIAPALTAFVAIFVLFTSEHEGVDLTRWIVLIVGSLLVGFCEELVTRGVLIVGFRARFGELSVWALSTGLFAALHLPNGLFGVGPLVVLQVFLTFLIGSTLYVLRRSSGSLIAAMLLHGLWDLSSFSATDQSPFVGYIAIPLGIFGVVCAVISARHYGTRNQ